MGLSMEIINTFPSLADRINLVNLKKNRDQLRTSSLRCLLSKGWRRRKAEALKSAHQISPTTLSSIKMQMRCADLKEALARKLMLESLTERSEERSLRAAEFLEAWPALKKVNLFRHEVRLLLKQGRGFFEMVKKRLHRFMASTFNYQVYILYLKILKNWMKVKKTHHFLPFKKARMERNLFFWIPPPKFHLNQSFCTAIWAIG